jgi:hypothetical protein
LATRKLASYALCNSALNQASWSWTGSI